ncbi:hypothetical protein DFAR_1350009 [Desulfarculales bacterium]
MARLTIWRIVVISPRQLKEICHDYRVGWPGQCLILPLGIDLEPYGRPRAGARRLPGRAGAQRGGLPGEVEASAKNYSLWLETAAALKQARSDLWEHCRWALIGGGSETAGAACLSEQDARLGPEGQVLFLGNRLDSERFMAGLDALLLTSLNEGTPMVILEAGACGVPVLSTAGGGGVPDLLGRPGKNASVALSAISGA